MCIKSLGSYWHIHYPCPMSAGIDTIFSLSLYHKYTQVKCYCCSRILLLFPTQLATPQAASYLLH